MFCKQSPDGAVPVTPGITRKTIAYGAKSLMTEFQLARGSVLPRHSHPHEQTGYLIAGRMRMAIGGEAHDVRPGDSWCIPGNVEHGADILEDSVAVEVFAPVREDFLPKKA